MARTSSVRPAPISPAMPKISPLSTEKLTSLKAASGGESDRSTSSSMSLSGCAKRREHALDAAADHLLDDGAHRNVGACRIPATMRAVAHHHDAVGDLRDLVQPVADIDEADAFRLELARSAGTAACVSSPPSAAVGSSKISSSAFERQRLGDLDLLLRGDAQGPATLRSRRDVEARAASAAAEARSFHGRAVDAAAVHRLAADIDVLGDRQIAAAASAPGGSCRRRRRSPRRDWRGRRASPARSSCRRTAGPSRR